MKSSNKSQVETVKITRKFLPNQYEFLGKKIYVAQSHSAADDGNDGSRERPLKTINAAMRLLKMGDHVYIDQGIYREEIMLPLGGHPYDPNSQIHFHALEEREVYIKGSDIYTEPWQEVGAGVWETKLPLKLFDTNGYNPYCLALAKDVNRVVRPCDENEDLARTKGQIYVDHKPYQQVTSSDIVNTVEDTFIVSSNGTKLIVNFGSVAPSECLIELSVRRRCIVPDFDGAIFMQTHGICIEHAAEPGPFCKDQSVSLRENPKTSGIQIEKTFSLPGAAGASCTLLPGQVCYTSTDDDTITCSVLDDTYPVLPSDQQCIDALSFNAGRTWVLDENTRTNTSERDVKNYFLDESRNVLMRNWVDHVNGKDPHGAFGVVRHNVMFQFSRDGGKTWGKPKLIDDRKSFFLSIVLLDDGSYVWPYYTNDEAYPECGTHHHKVGTLLGKWNADENDIVWRQGGFISVSPQESNCGLSESCIVQCNDGRLVIFLRAGATHASQEHPGVASVKLVSVSDDGGQSWTHPKPLCYEDGKYLYSPRSYQMAFKSIKNGRIYILLNITDEPTAGCDPRTHLFMAEVDSQTLRVPRASLTLIEAIHPEQNTLTRFSNFQMLQDRKSKNPILFMKLDMSEFCPIRQGYDRNMYRYEVYL